MSRIVNLGVTFCTLISLTAPALADRWNVQAGSCPVDAASNSANRFLITAAGMKFSATGTGDIVGVCSVNNDLGLVAGIGITGVDTDGTSTNVSFSAAYKRTNKITGSVASLGSVSSNASGTTTYKEITAPINGGAGYTMDNVNYSYYVEYTVRRGLTTDIGELRHIELQY
jgi:hypothetical protein